MAMAKGFYDRLKSSITSSESETVSDKFRRFEESMERRIGGHEVSWGLVVLLAAGVFAMVMVIVSIFRFFS